jgi:uncharacterized protein (TIGR03083 family)
MVQNDASWNFMDPAAKDRVLRVVQAEIDGLFDLVADPERWQAPTACEHWEVRDVVGHLVDTTEGYLPAFGLARTGDSAAEPHGLAVMSQLVDEQARSLRKVPRDELVERLRDDAAQMMREFMGLTDDEWTGLIVPHSYMGPLPAMFYPVFQLVDYAVHSWDIREGIGQPHGLSGDAADLLIPVIYILWQATADVSGVTAPFSVGVRTSGHNGGDVRFDVSPDGVQYGPGDVSDLPAILEFDPATLVLTGYARMNGGTVWGDRDLAGRFRSLFFPI